ncbi:MAG: hypothetical protein GYA24_02345 [Candidatus Lokiarchaeota archaeon]|nr:hypothetical protein [Candidatus Lokiarchaeota archaeon]
MAEKQAEYPLDLDFSNDLLFNPAWAVCFFSDTLHYFRWSGLSGVVLDPGNVSIIGFLQPFTFIEKETTGFSIVAIRSNEGLVSSLFAIPVHLAVDTGAQKVQLEPGLVSGLFRFKDGTRVRIQILMHDASFWKRLSRALLVQFHLQKGFLVDMLDPGFSSGILTLRDLPEDAEGIDIKFLGGGDTTNIVIKFVIPSGLNFVLKFYPRIAFNTARYLNDMLTSAKFHQFARMVAACDYPVERIQSLLSNSMGSIAFNEIKQKCAEINMPVNRFFPFIHLLQFIPGNGDGGMPFWNSAIDPLNEAGKSTIANIVISATKLGKTIAAFHQALKGKAIKGVIDGAAQLKEQRETLAVQFEKTRAHLAGYRPSLPPEFSPLISGALTSIDFETMAKKIIPGEVEFQRVERQYVHQDLHLGQLMFIDALQEFYILDLEGDPQLSWRERLECSPVERDLASLIRSLAYIKIAALKKRIEQNFKEVMNNVPRFNEIYPLFFVSRRDLVDCLHACLADPVKNQIKGLVKNLDAWEETTRNVILGAYEKERPYNRKILLFYTLQRIMNEITYEIKFRPKNFFIPLVGLLALVET